MCLCICYLGDVSMFGLEDLGAQLDFSLSSFLFVCVFFSLQHLVLEGLVLGPTSPNLFPV